jgi:hypothetical protein
MAFGGNIGGRKPGLHPTLPKLSRLLKNSLHV